MDDPLDKPINTNNETYNAYEPANLASMEYGGGSEGGGEDWLASKPVVAKRKNNTKCAGGLLIYQFLKAIGQIQQICRKTSS